MKNYIKYYVYLFALFSVIIGAEMKTMYNNFESSKINLLYSDIHSTSLSLELSDFDLYEIEGHEGKFKINLEQGTPILEYGMPDLPKISTSIIIPDDRNMSILVESAEYEEYQNIHIAP